MGLLDDALLATVGTAAGFYEKTCGPQFYGKVAAFPTDDLFHPGRRVVRCNRNGRYIPPQCQDNAPADLDENFDSVLDTCREIYSPGPSFGEGVLENFLAAGNLKIVVKYLGREKYHELVGAALAKGREKYPGVNLPVLFWTWAPEAGLVALEARPVAFDSVISGGRSRCEAAEDYGKRFPGGSGDQGEGAGVMVGLLSAIYDKDGY